ALRDLLDRAAGGDLADVDDREVRDRLIGRNGGRRDEQQRSRRVVGVGPQIHLVWFHRSPRRRCRPIALVEPGAERIAQVEELDLEWELRVVTSRAVMDHVAAPERHDHEELLLRPDPQLTRRDADVASERRADLPDDVGLGWVGDVEYENAGV